MTINKKLNVMPVPKGDLSDRSRYVGLTTGCLADKLSVPLLVFLYTAAGTAAVAGSATALPLLMADAIFRSAGA